MAVFTFEDEITSTVPPAKLYNAMKDADSITPKIIDDVKSVEIVEGNGGPGTIKKLTIVEDGETKFILHKVESIDEANYAYNYSVVGGVALPPTAEKITFETKLVEGPNGGSIGKLTLKYHTKGDAKPDEEELKKGKAKGEDGETKFILHKVESIDEANYAYNYSVVGGVALPPTAEKITFETKLVEGPNGGSIGKLTLKYHTKGDAKPDEEELKKGKAKGEGLFRAIEGYALANPSQY
ncbi:hypothetical protein Ahy_B01g055598 isoform C [Arachis hypogaea]|uniref:Bet v I/Major latex protein domain-containing protein n=1 Tax=Arachis hypogaea TaxID=3818 RepID=A0A445AWN7_ARAHY|nr:hypothetical protein Ahy_B01g055598 isoform C [Arachis hypogaea]